MARTRFFYDYSPTTDQSNAVSERITHHFRIDKINMTFEIGPLHILTTSRPQFQALLTRLKADDILVCHSVCSLGSSASDVLQVLKLMETKGVQTHCRPMGTFISASSYWAAAQMLKTLIAAEAAIRADRTTRSLNSARLSGVRLGRPVAPALRDQAAALEVIQRLEAGQTQTSIAADLGVHRRTIKRLIEKKERLTDEKNSLS